MGSLLSGRHGEKQKVEYCVGWHDTAATAFSGTLRAGLPNFELMHARFHLHLLVPVMLYLAHHMDNKPESIRGLTILYL